MWTLLIGGLVCAGIRFGLDVKDLFQPKQFYATMILGFCFVLLELTFYLRTKRTQKYHL